MLSERLVTTAKEFSKVAAENSQITKFISSDEVKKNTLMSLKKDGIVFKLFLIPMILM